MFDVVLGLRFIVIQMFCIIYIFKILTKIVLHYIISVVKVNKRI